MTLTAVSLFAGVGGFDLAMQRNGIKTVATVEIDKNARGVLQHQFPEATHFEDVTKVTGHDLRAAGFIPERGIITGGFPCQDLSVAGKRAGLAGQRSGLYWEIIRLVDELSPKYLVLENVPGLLSSNDGRDMGIVIGALTERGYGVSWRVLDAQYFGVAQRRRRVFIVGCAGDDGAASAEILALSESLRGDSAKGKPTREDPATDAGAGAPVLLTMREGKPGGGKGPLLSINQSLTLATGNGQVLISGGGSVVNCLPAELYHKSTLTNQDVNSNHLVITASEPSAITQQTERLEP
jgi:DNA (cytosine-5)-methyltransferase 1